MCLCMATFPMHLRIALNTKIGNFLKFTAYHFAYRSVDIFQLHKITVGSEDFSRYNFPFSRDQQVDRADYTVKSAAKFPYCFPQPLSLK